MKTTNGLIIIFSIVVFSLNACMNRNIYSSVKKYTGVIVFEYKYLDKYERYWYNTSYFMDWKSTKYYFPVQKVPYYGDSCKKVLEELINKEGQVDLYESPYYSTSMASKSGFHSGGDTYLDKKDSTKLSIAFYLELKGHLIYQYCEEYVEDYEEIPCNMGQDRIYPYLFIYEAKNLRTLNQLELNKLNFFPYKKSEFPVGYCE